MYKAPHDVSVNPRVLSPAWLAPHCPATPSPAYRCRHSQLLSVKTARYIIAPQYYYTSTMNRQSLLAYRIRFVESSHCLCSLGAARAETDKARCMEEQRKGLPLDDLEAASSYGRVDSAFNAILFDMINVPSQEQVILYCYKIYIWPLFTTI